MEPEATIKKYLIIQNEGSRQVNRKTNHYNLQMIIAVGFKVNNDRAVQFRKWANGIVKDYTIKGWVMDEERLKNVGSVLTVEYFDRLLEKFVKSACRSVTFVKKSRIFMQRHWIMIKRQKRQSSSLPRFRIRCIMLCMGIRLQN